MISIDTTFIGERSHPQDEEGINKARYLIAASYSSGKDVLDIGCGSGYGSATLASIGNPQHITAIDKEAIAIQYAKEHHSSPRITFLQGSLSEQKQNQFDVVIAHEIIEHIKDDQQFVSELCRVVRDNGLVLVSTPNKLISSPHSDTPPNPYHVREYTPDAFKSILETAFSQVQVSAIMLKNSSAAKVEQEVQSSLIWRMSSALVQNRTIRTIVNIFPRNLKRQITGEYKIKQKATDFELTTENIESYPYLYAICRP